MIRSRSRISGFRAGAYAAFSVLAGAAMLSSSAASASDTAPTVTVHYKDLNLDTDEGARTLYRRIRIAASAVCSQDSPSLHEAMLAAQCRKAAVASAVTHIANSRVAAIYAASGSNG